MCNCLLGIKLCCNVKCVCVCFKYIWHNVLTHVRKQHVYPQPSSASAHSNLLLTPRPFRVRKGPSIQQRRVVQLCVAQVFGFSANLKVSSWRLVILVRFARIKEVLGFRVTLQTLLCRVGCRFTISSLHEPNADVFAKIVKPPSAIYLR